MPHMKGESYTDYNTSYVYIYTDYLPVEFFCNGIISACLTFINVMCIFITAIIVLKVRKVGIVNPRANSRDGLARLRKSCYAIFTIISKTVLLPACSSQPAV